MILHIENQTLLFELADFYLDFKLNKVAEEEVKALTKLHSQTETEDNSGEWNERLLIIEGLSNIAKGLSSLEATYIK